MLLTIRSMLLGVALLALAAPHAFATPTFCSTETLASIQALPGGCVAGDVNISGISNPVNTGNEPGPSSTGLSLAPSGGVVSGSNISSLFFQIQNSGSSQTWTLNPDPAQTDTLTTVLDFTLNVVPGVDGPPESGNTWMITGFGMAGSFGGNSSFNTIVDKVEFCLGDATFDCTAASTNYGYFLVNYTGGSSSPFTRTTCTVQKTGLCATNKKAVTTNAISVLSSSEISFQETVTLSIAPGAAGATTFAGGVLLSQSDLVGTGGQGAVPEPSTYLLIATGVLVVWLGVRLKRSLSELS